MATITGLTAERMLEIEAASVVDGDVVGDDLILERHDGTIINAGNVRGGPGPTGPMGEHLDVVSGLRVAEVGTINQIRAGRQLTPADFTAMGLGVPLGLWNLSNANDSSGAGRHLTIKGGVSFGPGINGLASTAGVFAGSTGQVLYRADAGAGDPFRIKTGSMGCWFRTPKRGVSQYIITKRVSGARAYEIYVDSAGKPYFTVGNSPALTAIGNDDCCDDRWHFIVGTYDSGAAIRIYIDGVCTAFSSGSTVGPIPDSTAPFNIGGGAGDASTVVEFPFYGRIDEAFITDEVLSEEQIRNLYCASVPHALGSSPASVALAVRRRRRGAVLSAADFPTQPVRLYNLDGSGDDLGSHNIDLAGGAPIVSIAGPDGRRLGAMYFPGGAGVYMQASDAGLPAGLSARSYGIWFKAYTLAVQGLISWGVYGTADNRIQITTGPAGTLACLNVGDNIVTPYILDGLWHHVVVVEDPAPADGLKRKVYLDGRLVGSSTVLNSITLTGANGFRVGANGAGNTPADDTQLARAFVYAGVLTAEQVFALYNVTAQQLAASPKDSADHIEAVEAGRLLAVFDTLETTDLIDLAVMT